ncbi:MAG: hypothetical protein KatS3mg129_2194 [Leptospiraceae bacterium]|nr:MAG: hypothetical protein KatS3mg129_2194 [Leptospiraceae bacterium]
MNNFSFFETFFIYIHYIIYAMVLRYIIIIIAGFLFNYCVAANPYALVILAQTSGFLIDYRDTENIRKFYLEDANYHYLKEKYRWFKDEIYVNVRYYCLVDSKVVFSLIDIESKGNMYLNANFATDSKNFKHRPIGLMQVMSYHVDYPFTLTNVNTNIKVGCGLLNDCYLLHNKNLLKTLSCYKYGKFAKKFHYQYSYKILKNM